MIFRSILSLMALVAIAIPAQTDPAPTLTGTEEIVSGRGATTRVWENVYLEPVLDADGNPTGEVEERRSQFVELADGLCYDARTPEMRAQGEQADWQPTVTDWVATDDPTRPFEVTTGPLQVRLLGGLLWDEHVQVGVGNDSMTLGVAGLAMQDTATGRLQILETPRRVQPAVRGNRVLYPGVFTCADIEYVYNRGSFEQNLIITQPALIPDPLNLGFDAATTVVGLASTLNLDSMTGDLVAEPISTESESVGVSVDATSDLATLLAASATIDTATAPLSLETAAGREVLRFAQGTAWDATGSQANAVPVRQSVVRQGSRDLLFDGVDHSWLTEAEGDVTIDYTVTTSGNQEAAHRTFVRGITYYVSSYYSVNSGEVLAIEPGAILKVNATKRLDIAQGGQIIARGEPCDPVFFTWADNDSVGEVISSATPGKAAVLLNMDVGSTSSANISNQSIIEHCRFSGGVSGVQIQRSCNREGNPIAHSIFRDCGTGIGLWVGSAGQQVQTVEVVNCLFAPAANSVFDNNYGVEAVFKDNDQVDLTVTNCTFADLDAQNGIISAAFYAHSLAGCSGYSHLTANFQNNMTVNCEYALRDSRSFGWTADVTDVTHNGYFGNNAAADFTGAFVDEHLDTGNNKFSEPYPFVTSDAGGFYTVSQYRETGWDSDIAELSTMTTTAPAAVTGAVSGNWTRNAAIDDGNRDDLGFHYPHVDYVLSNNAHGISVWLSIGEGVVIAYAGSNSSIFAGEDAYLAVNGTDAAGGLVLCLPVTATGDAVDDVIRGAYSSAFTLFANARSDSQLRNVHIRGAVMGIFSQVETLSSAIENCRFVDCCRGLTLSAVSRTAVRNNLFLRSGLGGSSPGALSLMLEQYSYSRDHEFRVEGNTFSQCGRAIVVDDFEQEQIQSTDSTLALVLEDNVFVQCDKAISTVGGNVVALDSDNVAVVDRNNAWYANASDLDDLSTHGIFTTGSIINPRDASRGNIIVNPMLVHAAGRSQARYDVTDTGLFGDDGFFLAQSNGEASRFPLIVPSGLHLDNSNGIEVVDLVATGTGKYVVYAGVADVSSLPGAYIASPPANCMGYRDSVSGYADGNQTGNGAGRLWIALMHTGASSSGKDGLPPSTSWSMSSAHFRLLFDNSASPNEDVYDLDIHLPAIDFEAVDDDKAVWVGWIALDGSVYHGNSTHPIHVDKSTLGFDMDADFAMAYDDWPVGSTPQRWALACGYYDSIYNPVYDTQYDYYRSTLNLPPEEAEPLAAADADAAATSPAVDRASRDFLNSGYTTAALDTEDNPAPLDQYATSHQGTVGVMDIGYHYRGTMRFPRQQVSEIDVPTYIWPIGETGREWDLDETVPLSIGSHREVDIVSGHFNNNPENEYYGQDLTIAFAPTAIYTAGTGFSSGGGQDTVEAMAIAAIVFRGEDDMGSDIDVNYIAVIHDDKPQAYVEYASNQIWEESDRDPIYLDLRTVTIEDCIAIDACAVPSNGSGDAEGTLYVAAVLSFMAGSDPFEEIRLWRVDIDETNQLPGLANAGGIGAYELPGRSPAGFYDNERVRITDVALCADNSARVVGNETIPPGLYVSWIEEYEDEGVPTNPAGIGTPVVRCQYLPGSVLNGPATGISGLGRHWIDTPDEGPPDNTWLDTIVDYSYVVDGMPTAPAPWRTAFSLFPLPREGEYLNSVAMDFDFSEGASGQPRLIYFDHHDDTALDYTEIGPRQALITLNPSSLQPNGTETTDDAELWLAEEFSTGTVITAYFGTSYTARLESALTVNHAAEDHVDRAFANYTLNVDLGTEDYDLWVQPLQQDIEGDDDWLTPVSTPTLDHPTDPSEGTPDLLYPDVTWRFSGTPRPIAAQAIGGNYTSVTTDTDQLYVGTETLASSLYPHITTNGENLVDNFAVYVTTEGTVQVLNLVQVDP